MGTITFSEYAIGTINPTFSFSDNWVFTHGGIRSDGSNKTSPVLAGSASSFELPISVSFLNPVSSIVFDAGYFDSTGSTRVEFYDLQGTVLETQTNSGTGIQKFSISTTSSVAGFSIFAQNTESNGFAIDNISFQTNEVKLPTVTEPTLSTGVEFNLGLISSARQQVYYETLGPSDRSDKYLFSLQEESEVTWRIFLSENKDKYVDTKIIYDKGVNYLSINDENSYSFDRKYGFYALDVKKLTTSQKSQLQQAANDVVEGLLKGAAIDLNHLAVEIGRNINSKADIRGFHKIIADGLGKASILLDVYLRLDNVLAAEDPREEFFVQLVDTLAGFGASGVGTVAGGLLGGPIGAALGGFGLGIVYNLAASDTVKETARELYNDAVPDEGPFKKLALLAADFTPIEFDEKWYLSHYTDAGAGVRDGSYGSAYSHYLLSGIFKGYLPNADATALNPKTVLGAGRDELADLNKKNGVLEVAAGELPGDKFGRLEKVLFDLVHAARSEGTDLVIDASLTTAANRKAIDLIHNLGADVSLQSVVGDDGWDQKWSSGATLLEGLEDFAPSLSDVQLFTIVSDSNNPSDVLGQLRADLKSRAILLDESYSRVGIAEYGGVWVIIFSADDLATDTPELEVQVPLMRRSGDMGDDHIIVGGWRGEIYGREGADLLEGGRYNDILFGELGKDNLYGYGGNDVLDGGIGNDVLNGGAGADRLVGGYDYDTASYAGATKGVVVNFSNIALNTNDAKGDTYSGIENATGTNYNDSLTGNMFANVLDGGAGNDTLNGGAGADKLIGGAGYDTASYAGATKGVIVNFSNIALNINDAKGDTYSGIENATGTSYNDSLTGNAAANILDGGAGNDILNGGAGADRLIGGAGIDAASYSGATKGVLVNFMNIEFNTNDAKGDTYSGIENLTGSSYADALAGNSAVNVISGGAGDDRLYGRLGNDLLIGGSGKDAFVFDTKLGSTNTDTIDDFIATDDTIWLDDDIFTQAGKVGDLKADAFFAGTKAQDATDRIIYDKATGKLWYDADGFGAGKAIQFATLDKGLTLTAANFDIIG